MHTRTSTTWEFPMFEEFAPYRSLFMAAFVVAVTWNLFHVLKATMAWRANDTLAAAFYSYKAVAFLWPTSLIAKILIIGPSFLRWHVGDIGFVLMLPAMIKLTMSVPAMRKSADEPLSAVYMRSVDNLMITKYMVFVMTVIITGYEVLMGVLYKTHPDVEPIGVGSFDPIDVAMYLLGAFIGAKLLNVMADKFRDLAAVSQAHETLVANELRAQQRQNRTRPQKARKHHNPSRK